MTRPARPNDPLADTELLLIDANNLIHALGQIPGSPPAPALVARIRSLVPTRIAIELIFDGRGERGMRGTRIAHGLSVRYAGARSADAVIVDRVGSEADAGGPVATAAILVVTNDRGLADLVRRRGARTAGASWLASRLAMPERGSGASGPRPPRSRGDVGAGTAGTAGPAQQPDGAPRQPDGGETDDETDDDRPGWRSGRGATTKRGNPRRAPRHRH